jgi:hypothetical protein
MKDDAKWEWRQAWQLWTRRGDRQAATQYLAANPD